jgi:hypothetical protein
MEQMERSFSNVNKNGSNQNLLNNDLMRVDEGGPLDQFQFFNLPEYS